MDYKCCCSNILDINSIQKMTNSFLDCTIPIIIEKECGFQFIMYINEYSKTLDLYRYVEQYYSHLDEGKVLFLNKGRNKIIFRNDNIKIKNLFSTNEISSITKLPERTVYKVYLSLL